MTNRTTIGLLAGPDKMNFLLTNMIPRRLACRFIGWFSKIENPVVCAFSVRIWRLFSDLDLSEAHDKEFRSMHDCFTRKLKDGARPFDPRADVLASPSDGIVGATGRVEDGRVLQVKGFSYEVADLLQSASDAESFRGGTYVTIRLTSSMYHRFHAPADLRVRSVTHVPGDAWNVNPPTLARVDRLFCKNERAVIRTTLTDGAPLFLVPVAAILVSGIRLGFQDMARPRGDRARKTFDCDASLHRGEEMGWFEHGSTIVVFAPAGFALSSGIVEGIRIRAGQALMRASGLA